MTEFQKIAIGLLGLSHPETQRLRSERSSVEPRESAPQGANQESRPGALMRAAKFAFAALLTGSRAIPLGDNGCLTRELGALGTRLRTH